MEPARRTVPVSRGADALAAFEIDYVRCVDEQKRHMGEMRGVRRRCRSWSSVSLVHRRLVLCVLRHVGPVAGPRRAILSLDRPLLGRKKHRRWIPSLHPILL
jgi:hypothetical protein